MTTYLDSSAWLKRYIDEPGSGLVAEILADETIVVTCALAEVEVRRNLQRIAPDDAPALRRRFGDDLRQAMIVHVDAVVVAAAASIAEATLARSLDAVHLAAAQRVGGGDALRFLTFDHRQALVARDLGFAVVGV